MSTDVASWREIDEARAAAERVMPEAYRDFVNNAGMEETLRDDIAAWRALHLRPRALADVSAIDTSIDLLGRRIAAPIIVAPFVGSSFIDPQGEVSTARAAAAAGTIMTLSMTGRRGPEEVGAAAPGYWQQLYWLRDRGVLADIVQRAVDSGASALCLTVDLPAMPAFPQPMATAFSALQELWRTEEHLMYFRRYAEGRDADALARDQSVTWADLEWLRGLSSLPLVLKGIIRPEDAVLARDHGAAAVIVSNHAGQALRYSMPVAHALPSIVEAVGADLPVLADSGIRSGHDVVRALALGATAVLVGRPVLWGLAAAGAPGVERVLAILKDQLVEVMALTGTARVAEIDRAVLATSWALPGSNR